ncbi:MAG: DNA gyrase C-terminal beta-propeller domain-containing protein [Hyphomonadaceae bacterium]
MLLVTDKGQLIRTGVDQIRIAGRATQGVILINVSEDEHVVAASRLEALNGEADAEAEAEEGEA